MAILLPAICKTVWGQARARRPGSKQFVRASIVLHITVPYGLAVVEIAMHTTFRRKDLKRCTHV